MISIILLLLSRALPQWFPRSTSKRLGLLISLAWRCVWNGMGTSVEWNGDMWNGMGICSLACSFSLTDGCLLLMSDLMPMSGWSSPSELIDAFLSLCVYMCVTVYITVSVSLSSNHSYLACSPTSAFSISSRSWVSPSPCPSPWTTANSTIYFCTG